ncbi:MULTISPECIES: MFS transporter [unclassified Brevibacterium]|uniref:MFS transporter n=1 Tax=unclassified Brevibacterium TaxID=2614124 RepID=UPI00194FE0B8|nr:MULTISPECIES: MFS transporter [unclassified Brevibacterium]MBM6590296.1 MHS family MFS transporter [Brevibacterium sp. RIT 803]MCF2588675.1 MHS family MFS transporter [Brevibacterium sp. UCMA 11752]
MTTESTSATIPIDPKQKKRVALASAVGTSVEWYDYHVYSIASALVIGRLFFPEASPLAGTMAAFATFAIGFIARPLGGILAGHLGDRIGRKKVMVITLTMMGVATTLIGLLPTYAQIGAVAPVLLVVLRLLQGLSAGGEWGSAALMAVEHAPDGQRGRFGNYVQLGTPAGMFLANVVILGATFTLSESQFESWGWRVPFMLSALMVVLGFIIRSKVDESPVFKSLAHHSTLEQVPLWELLKTSKKRILLAVLSFLGNNACGYIFLAFLTSYGTATVGMSRNFMLDVLLVGCLTWFGSMIIFSRLSDRVGRLRVYLGGYVGLIVWAIPFFALFSTGNKFLMILSVVVLTFGLAATYGPQAALFAELFPARFRASGVSLSYAIGACLGGGFAPLIATAVFGASGTIYAVSAFMITFCLISIVGLVAMKGTPNSFSNDSFKL